MNVLADRHHAGLFRSLQLLAGRLEWTLYTPSGNEWWDEGYWNFGRRTYGDDRLARQFLGATGTDEEFPAEVIRYVTLPQAREMRWDIVIASLDDNQAGFHRFAAETGARYVVQCGNTGQYIDWSLRPFVLNSSEMPLLGDGITYHQEIDAAFRFRDPIYSDDGADRTTVRSFVHLMNETHAFPLWNEMRAGLPGYRFERFGHAPPEPDPTYVTNLKPIGAIASAMAGAGWGFHDKPVGDGHGHVIHGWARTGRPLIGHSSHYRGKLAEIFWTPETAIDLDAISVPMAAATVRAINAEPERHRAMCVAMRNIFDQNIDYAREAGAIRGALS